MINTIDIWDFDGTICDSSHRYRAADCGTKIDLQYWIDNENKTYLDTPIEINAMRFREYRELAHRYCIIATARIWCEQSQEMAAKFDLLPNGLVARKDRHDTRGGAALKIAYVNKLLCLKQFRNVTEINVFEDNATYMHDIGNHYIAKGFAVQKHFFPSCQGL